MGPTLTAVEKTKKANPDEKGYYDASNPGSCEPIPQTDNSIDEMNAHNLKPYEKMRVNEKNPLPYYDPSENMDRNVVENLRNSDLYVVPIQV